MIDGVKPVGAEWVYDAVSIGFAVLHVAVRVPRGTSIVVDGRDVVPEVHAVLDAITEFSNRVSDGVWKGYTGERIRNARQHPYRGVRPRHGDGLRGVLQRSGDHVSIRLERRRDRQPNHCRFRIGPYVTIAIGANVIAPGTET